MDAKFKGYHLALLHKLQDKEKLEEEQVVLNEHDDEVSDFMERLLRLENEVKPEEVKHALEVVKTAPDSFKNLVRLVATN